MFCVLCVVFDCFRFSKSISKNNTNNTNNTNTEQSGQYELKYHREKIRENYNTFVSDFSSLLNDIRNSRETNKPVTPEMLQQTFKVVLRGVKLLNQWNAQIIEQNAWKFANPITEEQFLALGGKISKSKEYEKALKFNYSPEEMYALVDVIGMIKG